MRIPYTFGSSVTLVAGDTYYLYEDTLISEGTISGSPQTSNEFANDNRILAPTVSCPCASEHRW
jgi:hypothetical protein